MPERIDRGADRKPGSPSGRKAHRGAGENTVSRLQRQVGNRAVAGFLRSLSVQREKEGDGPSQAVGIIQQQLNAVGSVPRLAITGIFDAETTAATKAFQNRLIGEKVAGIVADGVVAGETHKQLDARAPSVSISGQKTVVDGPGSSQNLFNPAAGVHQVLDKAGVAQDLKQGDKGSGVKELQERVNNSPTMSDAARAARATATQKLKVDGSFGPLTAAALKQFQTDQKVPSTGVADPATWVKLQAAGFSSQGHAEFDWREEVEGVKNVGLRAGYDWKLSKTALTVTAPIKFVKKDAGVDAKISEWVGDIKQLWSTFRAVNVTNPKATPIDLDFQVTRSSSGHQVDVFQFDHSLAKADRPNSRSNSGTWYTIDPRRSMAPHEFGHLIGLADEYNRTEEHYVAVTGEEPGVGTPGGTAAQAAADAAAIKKQLPLNDKPAKPIAAWNDPRWGANLAAVVVAALGSQQGGYSRLVAQQYQKANGTKIYNDIQAAFNAKKVPGFQNNLSDSVTPFLYSNRSLMGTMETTPAKGAGGKAAPDHEHPIEPRHVKPFVDVITREWALQNGVADAWKPERR